MVTLPKTDPDNRISYHFYFVNSISIGRLSYQLCREVIFPTLQETPLDSLLCAVLYFYHISGKVKNC